ncbi:sigma-54 dependent transcriptional regulator [Alcanivorax sp. 1008]|uniref:sigma-54-dependent transcriptional regulator n=1 Tax=Alcanivorax sp. 1008 TaxID=2816853 RepID=UPI001E12C232|nr:sigma-54 dependent transcriptional regulator [Alcanivorax sp. 1008]MCC1497886.1 sigma-54-dependent Fis family transcriptional regulator [Alcanivorax sp. 1008]
MSHVLIVEDEPVIRGALRKLLERHDHSVVEAESVEQASDHDLHDFDLIISDLRLPGAPGTNLIQQAKPTPVLIMTSYASLRSAVDAMKLGAVDYIAKPFDHDEMVMAVSRILKERVLRRGHDVLRADLEQRYPVSDMVGESPVMQQLIQQVERIAVTDSSVLICGESGTGKELVARTLHYRSERSRGPMVSVNCAALASDELEQHLFGTERDDSNNQSRRGLAETADGGTLFLDEIDELSGSAQGRLLQLLESQMVQRLGATDARRIDTRVIGASHRDLARLATEGRFRKDLYYRLQVIQLALPPLRERGEDILLLADNLLERISLRLNLKTGGFSSDARRAMNHYSWPGNVRELENAIERAVILADGQPIGADLLGIDLSVVPTRTFQDPAEDLSLEDYFARFVMENQDHMTETELARKLGISRKCLWERRQRLGIPRSRNSSAGS